MPQSSAGAREGSSPGLRGVGEGAASKCRAERRPGPTGAAGCATLAFLRAVARGGTHCPEGRAAWTALRVRCSERGLWVQLCSVFSSGRFGRRMSGPVDLEEGGRREMDCSLPLPLPFFLLQVSKPFPPSRQFDTKPSIKGALGRSCASWGTLLSLSGPRLRREYGGYVSPLQTLLPELP